MRRKPGRIFDGSQKDVTVIARGKHLEAMQKNGLIVDTPHRGTFTAAVRAMTEEEYTEIPDVIFVCVKGYSLDSVVPFLQKHADKHTIILPILNIYGTGSALQKEIPNSLVLDGCIYIAAEIREPGRIWQKGYIFRVVFGVRDQKDDRPELKTIESDLRDAGITPLLTDHVKRDTFKKYAYVAPMAACALAEPVVSASCSKKSLKMQHISGAVPLRLTIYVVGNGGRNI